jgi:hypothetical protein
MLGFEPQVTVEEGTIKYVQYLLEGKDLMLFNNNRHRYIFRSPLRVSFAGGGTDLRIILL